jgi:tetratricopeptide (TPR) repeat protein
MSTPVRGEPTPAVPPARRGRLVRLVALVAVLAAAAAYLWWPQPAPPAPPLPPGIEDPEVLEVIETARRHVVERPRSAGTWGRLGLVTLAQQFDREADVCFAEAARLDPADPRWAYARGYIATKRQPEAALPLLRQASANAGAFPEYQAAINLRLAELLLERGDLDEAEKVFRAELDRDRQNARAVMGLAMVALARGDDSAAGRFLRIARTSPNARKHATAELAALARRQGDPAGAAALEAETANLPADVVWPDRLLEEIAELHVGERGWRRRLDRLQAEDRYAEAAELCLERVKKHPSAEAYMNAGINFARLRDYDRALPLLEAAVRLEPDHSHTHYSLALAVFARAERQRHEVGDSPQVRAWFEQALKHARLAAEIRPTHARAYLFWGLALKYLGDPAGAVAPLRRGAALATDNFDLQLALGEVLLDTGRPDEARTHLDNARRLNRDDPRPARALARLDGAEKG